MAITFSGWSKGTENLETNLTEINNKIGTSDNNESIFTKLKNLSSAISGLASSWTSARAGYLDKLVNGTYGLEAIKNAVTANSGGVSLKTYTVNVTCTSNNQSLSVPDYVKIGVIAVKAHSTGGTISGMNIPGFTQFHKVDYNSSSGYFLRFYTRYGASATVDIDYYPTFNRIDLGNNSSNTSANIALNLIFYYLQ